MINEINKNPFQNLKGMIYSFTYKSEAGARVPIHFLSASQLLKVR